MIIITKTFHRLKFFSFSRDQKKTKEKEGVGKIGATHPTKGTRDADGGKRL